jgi:hypothetical protein
VRKRKREKLNTPRERLFHGLIEILISGFICATFKANGGQMGRGRQKRKNYLRRIFEGAKKLLLPMDLP